MRPWRSTHRLISSQESKFQLLLVNPLDAEAAAFYARFGFAHLPGENRMYMLLKDLRKTLGE